MRETPLTHLRPARAARALRGARGASSAGSASRSSSSSSAPGDVARRATATSCSPSRSTTASPRVGYALVEEERPGRFDDAAGRRARRPVRARAGRAPARRGGHASPTAARSRPRELVGPARPGRTVVYTGDTIAAPRPSCCSFRGADLLVHEATFAEEEARAAPARRGTRPPPGRRGRPRRRRLAARADARLAALPRLGAPARGARGLPGDGRCPATST